MSALTTVQWRSLDASKSIEAMTATKGKQATSAKNPPEIFIHSPWLDRSIDRIDFNERIHNATK